MTFPTQQAAADYLVAQGFAPTKGAYFAKRGKTQGNLIEAPRMRVALCEVIQNRVDPKWAAEGYDTADYFTPRFH